MFVTNYVEMHKQFFLLLIYNKLNLNIFYFKLVLKKINYKKKLCLAKTIISNNYNQYKKKINWKLVYFKLVLKK